MSNNTEKWCKVWRKTGSWFQKWRGIWWILTREVESLKICTLIIYFCRKYVMIELKKQRSCTVKNGLWFQKWHKEFGEQVVESKVDKPSAYNIIAEGMNFLDKSSPSNWIFWTKVAHLISTFWIFHCFPEVVQISRVIFETRSQFLYKFGTILQYLS